MQAQDTRQMKARLLIANGAVTLRPGTGTALVRGSKGETYVVTREACSCLDFVSRGVDCKHRIGTRILCQEYRACAAQARRGETVRPSVGLLKAIGWDVEAPRPPVPALAPADCRVCGYPLVDGRHAEGLCARCWTATRRERMAA